MKFIIFVIFWIYVLSCIEYLKNELCKTNNEDIKWVRFHEIDK